MKIKRSALWKVSPRLWKSSRMRTRHLPRPRPPPKKVGSSASPSTKTNPVRRKLARNRPPPPAMAAHRKS